MSAEQQSKLLIAELKFAVINQQQRIISVLGGIISIQINGIKLQYMLFQQFDASCGVTHLSYKDQDGSQCNDTIDSSSLICMLKVFILLFFLFLLCRVLRPLVLVFEGLSLQPRVSGFMLLNWI